MDLLRTSDGQMAQARTTHKQIIRAAHRQIEQGRRAPHFLMGMGRDFGRSLHFR
jgi:hypothetical protein